MHTIVANSNPIDGGVLVLVCTLCTQYLKTTYDLLQPQFKQFIATESPHWIIDDLIPLWTAEIAREFGVPLVLFEVLTAACISFFGPLECFVGDGQKRHRSSTKSLTFPSAWITSPSSVAYRKHEANDMFAGVLSKMHPSITTLQKLTVLDVGYCPSLQCLPRGLGRLSNLQELSGYKLGSPSSMDGCRLSELTQLRVLRMNISEEGQISDDEMTVLSQFRKLKVLSIDYGNCVNKAILKKLVNIFPPPHLQELYLVMHRDKLPGVDIFVCTADPTMEPPMLVINTVLSVSSLFLTYEIAHGLELSNLPFLWALRRPMWALDDDDSLPSDFRRRIENRGVVCIGWVPQLEILAHPSICGSLFHSGWGSIVETLQHGHTLMVLPLVIDLGLNARLLVEKGLAVEVERSEDGSFNRSCIAKALRKAMVEEEGESIRLRLLYREGHGCVHTDLRSGRVTEVWRHRRQELWRRREMEDDEQWKGRGKTQMRWSKVKFARTNSNPIDGGVLVLVCTLCTQYLKTTYDLLQPQFKQFIATESPDWIIHDLIPLWTAEIAREFGVPLALFEVLTAACISFFGPLECFVGDGQKRHRSSTKSLTFPSAWITSPSSVAYRKHEANDMFAGVLSKMHPSITSLQKLTVLDVGYCPSLQCLPRGLGRLSNLQELSGYKLGSPSSMDGCRLSELTQLRVLRMNISEEGQISDDEMTVLSQFRKLKVLSIDYGNCVNKAILKKLVNIFPPPHLQELYLVMHRDKLPGVDIFVCTADPTMEPPMLVINTVLSVSSLFLTYEIAHGLELSNLPFLWALRRPMWALDDDDSLPSDFRRRIENRGVVCIGWVPQLEILAHPSICGSLFHSGWGSIVETLQHGHTLMVLPLVIDLGLNARLLVEKGLAVEVERSEDRSFNRSCIAKALRKAMVEEEGESIRV
ncbi:hypothetical protein HHK36_022855 [Tetracentron sinense]|uniref:Disease resistance R13L4/SHOC-2-like LRR domain-containing protein n=1 Tax=Tetracentron sinense TaxID=13715 RepID=A0A834YVK2_TETSI|nr:hypothetical protein HHK36_022855 [Tetracentron sinense]